MMYRLYIGVIILILGTCLAIPLPINTTALNNDKITTEILQKSVNNEPSTTTNRENNTEFGAQGDALTELGTQGDALIELEVHGNVVSSISDISETLPRDELEKKIQTLIGLIRNRARSFPEQRLKPDGVKMDLNKTIYSTNVLDSIGSTQPVRERRSNGVITVNVNCSEHPDLCQQAVAWLQQHDRQVPTSLSHWQG